MKIIFIILHFYNQLIKEVRDSMNYYIVIIVILICILPLGRFYILSNRECILNQQLLQTINLNNNISSYIKSQFNQNVMIIYTLYLHTFNCKLM